MLPDEKVCDPFLSRIPRLLVSVRDADEAAAALAGGADIIDVKEPARGSLGMADSTQIDTVLRAVRHSSPGTLVSAALGEARDWFDVCQPPPVLRELGYLKLGTAGLQREPNWQSTWLSACVALRAVHDDSRSTIHNRRPSDDRDPPAGLRPPRIIPVACADWRLAESPPPVEVLRFAIETGCAGVLIDTFVKQGQRLFDWIDVDELGRLVTTCHRFGLWLAAAGCLDMAALPLLCDCGVDIVGIRSAACRRRQRLSTIDAGAVAEFKSALRRSWDARQRSAAPVRAGCTN